VKASTFARGKHRVSTYNPLTIPESSSLAETIRLMRARRVRRAPVISKSGDLAGIISLDDLLPAVASQLNELATLLGTQARRELSAGKSLRADSGGRASELFDL
jgi:CBS domain-containing protein